MNNFPYINHIIVKMVMAEKVEVDGRLVDQIATKLIKAIGLTVVKEAEHSFPKVGYTKIFILSQSHMIIHTWPENRAIHIDLMTCSHKNMEEVAIRAVKDFKPDVWQIKKLDY